MNKTIKIFILYCLPILTIQSCGNQCLPQLTSDPKTNSNNQNVSKNPLPVSSITDAICKKTKNYLLGRRDAASTTPFFEQTIKEIRKGNAFAVNKQNQGQDNFTVLHYAIYSDNEELFKELLKLSPDLAQEDTTCSTILLVAISQRKVNFVNILLNQPNLPTFINAPNSLAIKPLTYAKFIKSSNSNTPEEINDAKAIIRALKAKGPADTHYELYIP